MSDTSRDSTGSTPAASRHRAGWFDIRNVIGLLLLIYGIVLLVMGIFGTSDAELDQTDGVNANLWAGLGITAVGAFFLIWARVRPIVVDDAQVEEDKRTAEEDSPQ